MKISSFVIGTWRVMSILFVFGLSVFSYSLFSDDVGVHFDELGIADKFLSKSTIFYIAAALILVNNVLILNVSRRILTLPSHLLPIPNQTEWAAQRDVLNEHLKNWFYCLIATINTITGLGVLTLATLNSNQSQQRVWEFDWLFYLTISLLVVILLALPARLAIKPRLEQEIA